MFIKSIRFIVIGAFASLAVFVLTPLANAGVIIGGSSMLGGGEVSQLEGWLGEGPLTLTNIFTKGVDGTTGSSFHAAADGQGRTLSVMQVTKNGETSIIGGYNPQSWSSSSSYSFTIPVEERTAFIFNLSTSTIHYQELLTAEGQYQTFNYPTYGPTFGVWPRFSGL